MCRCTRTLITWMSVQWLEMTQTLMSNIWLANLCQKKYLYIQKRCGMDSFQLWIFQLMRSYHTRSEYVALHHTSRHSITTFLAFHHHISSVPSHFWHSITTFLVFHHTSSIPHHFWHSFIFLAFLTFLYSIILFLAFHHISAFHHIISSIPQVSSIPSSLFPHFITFLAFHHKSLHSITFLAFHHISGICNMDLKQVKISLVLKTWQSREIKV